MEREKGLVRERHGSRKKAVEASVPVFFEGSLFSCPSDMLSCLRHLLSTRKGTTNRDA